MSNEGLNRLNFDRITECDWCGEKKLTSITHYGTTHYNRLMCMDCAEQINERHRTLFNNQVFDLENSIIDSNPWEADEEEEW